MAAEPSPNISTERRQRLPAELVTRPIRPARAAIAAALLLATAFTPAQTRAADPYNVYVISAMSGGLSFVGKAIDDALGAYEVAFNKSGGIGGRPIHFVIEDAQTNPQVATQLSNDLKTKNVPVILGPMSAAECNAVFALLKTGGPVTWCFSSAVSAEPGSLEFQTLPTNYDYNLAAIKWARSRGLTRIALITPTDATGQTYDRAIDGILELPENKALKLVAHEHVNPGDVSVAAQLAKISDAQPQLLIVGTAGSIAGTIFHGIINNGLTVPVITGNGNASEAFMKQYAAILPKELYVESTSCLAPASMVERGQKAAYDAYVAAMTAHGTPVDCLQTIGWDPALIVGMALRKLGPNATAEQLRGYLAALRGFPAVTGSYDFKRVPQRGVDQNNVVIVRWDEVHQTWTPASKAGGAPL